MIKLSDHLYIEPMGRIVEQNRDARRRRAAQQRTFTAAKSTRLNTGWTTQSTTANYELRTNLVSLRARSREAFRNASHFKRFGKMCVDNVVGPQGLRLQCRAYLPDGKTLDRDLNKYIELKFWEWTHREHCSASGKFDWLGYQELLMRQLPRDGEALFQKIKAKNRFGFSLKQIDVSYLDENLNQDLPNGRQIIMSVEVDADYRPLAYWLTIPQTDMNFTGRSRSSKPVRVPADQIIHIYVPTEDESQVRGVPWGHAALLDGKNLAGYKEGVITSARMAANWVGFIEQEATDDIEFTGEEDSEGGATNVEINNEAGQINLLEPGMKVSQIDPKQPTQNHEAFYKSIVRDLAIALDVNYFSLQGDYAEVNLSSGRLGLNEERDGWRKLQVFVSNMFCREVYHAWLRSAWMSGEVELTADQYLQVQDPQFRGRGWAYMDPLKEVNANVIALESGQATYTDIYAEQGKDLIDVLETRKQEKELFEEYGFEYLPPKEAAAPAAEPMMDDEDEMSLAEKKAAKEREFSYSNGHAEVLN